MTAAEDGGLPVYATVEARPLLGAVLSPASHPSPAAWHLL